MIRDAGLVVVGSVALDSVTTPTDKVEEAIGGSALYFSAAAGLFTSVQVVGVVGDDFPWERISFLSERGVDLRGIETKPGKTFRWRGVYHEDMEGRDSLCTELNVFHHFQPAVPEAYRRSPSLFLGNIAPELQRGVQEQMTETRLTAVDTMNFWIEGQRSSLLSVIRRADILFLNESEVCELAGTNRLPDALKAAASMGPARVVVKRGPHGALMWNGETYFQCPALMLDRVVDPTGAGDAFAGGFMGYLASTAAPGEEDFRQALVYGNVVASFAVEDFGLGGLQHADQRAVEERRRELESSVSVRTS